MRYNLSQHQAAYNGEFRASNHMLEARLRAECALTNMFNGEFNSVEAIDQERRLAPFALAMLVELVNRFDIADGHWHELAADPFAIPTFEPSIVWLCAFGLAQFSSSNDHQNARPDYSLRITARGQSLVLRRARGLFRLKENSAEGVSAGFGDFADVNAEQAHTNITLIIFKDGVRTPQLTLTADQEHFILAALKAGSVDAKTLSEPIRSFDPLNLPPILT